MIWLGKKRGNLSDWLTQLWVRATGRSVDLSAIPWLDGPTGSSRIIGANVFVNYATGHSLRPVSEGTRGLLPDFGMLEFGPDSLVAAGVRAFYEQTSEYELDAWAEWRGAFRPFGTVLAMIFSRRLQQFHLPLSALDSSLGMTSEVTRLCDSATGEVRETTWVRKLNATGNVVYAGSFTRMGR